VRAQSHDLLRAALVSLDVIDGRNGCHAFAIELLSGIEPGAGTAHGLFGRFACGGSKVFLAHDNPFLIDAHHQDIRRQPRLLSLSGRIERIKILGSNNRAVLQLSFGDLSARRLVNIDHRFIERIHGRFFRHSISESVGVPILGQIELSIQRKHAGHPGATVPFPSDRHLSEKGHQLPLTTRSAMSEGNTFMTAHIISSRFPSCPKIEVALHEVPQQFGSFCKNKSFDGAMFHLSGYLTHKPAHKGLKMLTSRSEHLTFHRVRQNHQRASLGYAFPRYIPTMEAKCPQA